MRDIRGGGLHSFHIIINPLPIVSKLAQVWRSCFVPNGLAFTVCSGHLIIVRKGREPSRGGGGCWEEGKEVRLGPIHHLYPS